MLKSVTFLRRGRLRSSSQVEEVELLANFPTVAEWKYTDRHARGFSAAGVGVETFPHS